MSQLALLVTLTVRPGRVAEFVDEARAHAARTLAREPGCVRFEVLRPREGGDRVMLYERYVDDQAHVQHSASEHMALYRKRTGDMIAERAIVRCDAVD